MPNHLINETSPYLLQHAHNPVDWYPWGEEALALARSQDKPILLSIGYAACHWCHVMAHESFEDEETAAYMNRHFVNVKVDREERPDLDSIYMQAVIALTRSGGWPMTVFLTPEGEPFYGGTYFPPAPRYGMPSFHQILASVSQAWRDRRAEVRQGASELARHIQQDMNLMARGPALDADLLPRAIVQIQRGYDRTWGGFGGAPKFPQPMTIEFLLRHHARFGDQDALAMAEHTLQMMAHGGMYDQVGGGFARYATDDHWLVPHFEKMLYDNAQLSRVYLHAWQVTGSPFYRRVVEEVLDYVLREMRHPAGGFYSSQDADSEGVEGKFYVWQSDEIEAVLGEDADLFMRAYGVTRQGNWEGENILHLPRPIAETVQQMNLPPEEGWARLAAARRRLYEARARRVWPGLDDKVLTAWNGLMMPAFAEAGRALQRPDYVQAAVDNAEFLWRTMRQPNGRLWRTWKAGATARYNGYLEDYAYLADGLLALYQTVFDERWFAWATELADIMLTHFADEAHGGFFDTSDDHEALIQRPKDLQDNAVPSGNSMAAHVLLTLGLYTGEDRYTAAAEATVSALQGAMSQYPTGFAHWLSAAAFVLAQPQEIAIVGRPQAEDTRALLARVRHPYRPFQVVAVAAPEEASRVPLLQQRGQLEGRATAYVCRHFTCQRPVISPDALADQLARTAP